MKRDILNHEGQKIGELELPDGTPEEIWESKLSTYKGVPKRLIPDVTPRQFRQALVLSGITISNIEAMISQLPEPMKSLATIEWEYSTAFKRDNKLVNQMGPSLGFDSDSLDRLWDLAASL